MWYPLCRSLCFLRIQANKKKRPRTIDPGPHCDDEDAKVDLLLVHTRLFSFPPALPPAFRSRPDCTLGIGLPCGVTLRRLSEFLRRVPSAPRSACASRFNLRLRLFASTAPDTCQGSDLFQQGGCQQANLLAREAFASSSNLDRSATKSTLANEIRFCSTTSFNESES